jgi:N-acetylglucosamine kinase-like BadF-type ATPase
MLLLGIDGGGSKTAALSVEADGRVVGAGLSGGANYHEIGLDRMLANVRQAADDALTGREPDAICLGMAGADIPYDFEQIRGALEMLGWTCPVVLHNDLINIFRAGSRFPYGVAVICGFGFNAGGLGKHGQEYRLPAYGQVTGDKGGGLHIGYEAIGAAFRSWDGRGEPTLLAEMILRAFDAADFDALAALYAQGQVSDLQIGDLAPLVFEASESGDAVAQSILREQGKELGISALAALKKLDLVNDDCDVVLGGSVFRGKGALLIDTVRTTVNRAAPNANVTRLDVPPVVGAALLAADHAGIAADAAFMDNLRATLPGMAQVADGLH